MISEADAPIIRETVIREETIHIEDRILTARVIIMAKRAAQKTECIMAALTRADTAVRAVTAIARAATARENTGAKKAEDLHTDALTDTAARAGDIAAAIIMEEYREQITARCAWIIRKQT